MQQVLVIIIGVLVAVCALALLAQIWAWIALASLGMRVRNTVRDRVPHIKAARDTVMATLRENREQAHQIAATSKELTGIAKREAAVVNCIRYDAAHRFEIERERAGMVFAEIKERVEETTDVADRGIAQPWRDVRDLLRGIATGYRGVQQEFEREHGRRRPAA